ncbi:cytochrome c oxidase subunit II [Spongiivirga citrea]|uniref:Cytochrome c oxidase subunit 2 n=1 Tax=Spongiivirga citrea TaxID=1481457 RepID=A0A6M0CJT8_9FLAO|nr:cytochrome c oxidase subunit II [Spongiivirga citrea]NER18111.1 cytochrome c oxidase subunit II [Spongiivirga citrea]
MSNFLIFMVLVLVFIAVWQITKIFELSQVGADNSQIANDKDNKINGYLMFGFLVFIYVITIVCFAKYGHMPLIGNAASEHGTGLDVLMQISMALIFVVQIITQALLYYFAFKYRGEKGKKALFYADNDRLEFIWTIIPVITLAGLILYGLFTWTEIMDVDSEDGDPIVIELYAQQFNWKVRYAGADNTLGDANVRFLNDYEGKNVTGIDDSDPSGMDDVVSTTELRLPKGRKVLFKMRSQDVLHSAYMPHFRAQMNCVPGMITQFSFTPSKTTEEMRETDKISKKVDVINEIRREKNKTLAADEQLEPYTFDYLLLCNKICGTSHYNMQLKIVVEEEEDFNKWLTEQQTFAQVIQ